MDVTDTKSIQEAVGNVKDRLSGRGLDVLINNAGVMPVTKGGLEAMYLFFNRVYDSFGHVLIM